MKVDPQEKPVTDMILASGLFAFCICNLMVFYLALMNQVLFFTFLCLVYLLRFYYSQKPVGNTLII